MHMKKYYAPDNFNVYAHYVAIVQSSGGQVENSG